MKNFLLLFILLKLISSQSAARECNKNDTLNSLIPGQTFLTLSKDIDLYQPLFEKRTGHKSELASDKVALFINGQFEIIQDTKWNSAVVQLADAQIFSRIVKISSPFGAHRFQINKKYVLNNYDKNLGYIFSDIDDVPKNEKLNLLLSKYGVKNTGNITSHINQIALKAERSALDFRRSSITVESLKYNLGQHVQLEAQCK